MGFAGHAVLIAESVNAEKLRKKMNGHNNGHKDYLTTLEKKLLAKLNLNFQEQNSHLQFKKKRILSVIRKQIELLFHYRIPL